MSTQTLQIIGNLSLQRLMLLVLAGVSASLIICSVTIFSSFPVVLYPFPFLYLGLFFFKKLDALQTNARGAILIGVLFLHSVFVSYRIYNDYTDPFLWVHIILILLVGSLIFVTPKRFLIFIILNTIVIAIGLFLSSLPQPYQIASIVILFLLSIIWSIFYLLLQARIIALIRKSHKASHDAKELNAMIDAMTTMVAFKDADNRIIRVNRAHAEFVGKDPEFFKGKSLYELLPNSIAKEYHKADLEVIKSGKSQLDTLEQFETIDGRTRWVRSDKQPLVNEEGEVTGIVIFSTDVTEQILAKGQLRQNEALFRKIFEHSPYGIIITDFELSLLNVNSTFSKMIGQSTYDLIGKSLLSYSDGVTPIYQQLREKILDSNTLINDIITLKTADNRKCLVNFSATVMTGGDIPILIAFLEDITERHTEQLQLQEYSHQLENSNKELQQFTYIISHDLKEPLRMIRSYIQLLNRRHKEQLTTDAQEYMNFIIDGATRLNNMIDDLLRYSRAGQDTGQKEYIEFGELIFNVMTHLRLQINETKAEINILGESPTVYGNKMKLTLVLQNLLSNAIKYSNQGVTPQINIKISEQPDYWQFGLEDNGIGIDKDNIDTVFLIFRRLHKRHEYSGTGVGLSICKRIIENHGGEIWLTSEVGKGSTFFFTLAKK